jgi:hypothetical protein
MVLLPSRWSFVIGISSAIVGLTLWIVTFVREQQAVDDLVLERVQIPDSAIAPLSDADVGRRLVTGAGRMLVGPAAHARLAFGAQIIPLNVAYRLPPQLEEMKARIIGRFRRNAEDVVNNTVLGLEYDATTLDGVVDTNQLRMMPIRWFDFKASADMAAWMLVTRTGETCVHVARDYLVDRGGVLASPTHTRLANAVGVSTMAVTIDGDRANTCRWLGPVARARRQARVLLRLAIERARTDNHVEAASCSRTTSYSRRVRPTFRRKWAGHYVGASGRHRRQVGIPP